MEMTSSSLDHYSINGYDLLESQSDHYHHLIGLPDDEAALRYIDKMLMEEDMEEDMLHALEESSDFQEKERSFYELLGQNYPQESSSMDHVLSIDPQLPLNEVTMSRSKKSRHAADEFDIWTHADCGINQELEAQTTDLGNEAGKNSSTVHQMIAHLCTDEEADLRSLLISCAQSIGVHDHPAANELLRKIRPHTSPTGNVNQRLAHYFVLGLEARMAGTGNWMRNNFILERLSASDYFAAYCSSFVSTSFTRISIFASSKLIAVRSKEFAMVHIIDFGILHGVQWPAFIQRLAEREGGPPRLRITGIDHPQSDCDPRERMATTGSRLAHYASMFGVPFEYNAIVQSWESIRVEDLNIEKGEFVAVNCLYRAEILPDEMVDVESPRTKVFDLIRKMNPNIFVHAVASADYGSPYFITRFREALYHFWTLFDMMEQVIPSERPERMLLQGMLGSEAVNVIACEGAERVSRPETHKQWRLRHLRAGFKQLSFGRKVVGIIQGKVRNSYHKEFVMTEDHKWLLMSWKGRTMCGISCWKPAV